MDPDHKISITDIENIVLGETGAFLVEKSNVCLALLQERRILVCPFSRSVNVLLNLSKCYYLALFGTLWAIGM